MLKKLHLKLVLLLAAMVMGVGNVWAEEVVYYTFNTTSASTGTNNSYTGNCDIVWSGITWNIAGNTQQLPYRLGGKNITNTDRKVYSKTAMGSAITSIQLDLGTVSATLNSVKLTVSTAQNGGGTKIDEITKTTGLTANSTQTFTPTSPLTEWAEDAYYTFTFNVTVSGSSNKFVEFKEVRFYRDAAPAAPTFSRAAGDFAAAFDLTISGATGTTLKYTTDGTEPASSGTATAVATNTAVVAIPAETTRVRAIAIKDGVNSKETDATYTFVSKTEPTFTLTPASLDLKVGGEGTISLTTNSDGEVTFSCDDAHVTLTGTGTSRTVSADAEGSYTVNVSVASTATYMEKAGSVTVNVTKYETTVSIDDSGITNTNLKNGASAGSLSASVTYGDPATDVPAAAVTWTSSNKGVATVNETGDVTLMGVGNTTITATFAGTAAYDSNTATYNLTVTDTRQSFTWDLSTNSYDGTPTEELISWTNARAVMENVKNDGTKVNNYIPTLQSSTRFYNKNTLTITPSKGYSISSVEFSATTVGYATALANSTWTNAKAVASEKKVVVTPTNGANAISATIGATCGFTEVKVYYNCVVTITSAGYATFCCADAIDVTDVTGLKAYKAAVSEDVVTFAAVNEVPANQGLLLKGDAGTYVVPAIAGASSIGENALVGVTSLTHIDQTADGKTNFVLLKKDGVVGFFKVNATNGFNVSANTAYLSAPLSAGAKIQMPGGDETAVQGVEIVEENNSPVYNLQGQKVSSAYKGVVIVNGKKVINK